MQAQASLRVLSDPSFVQPGQYNTQLSRAWAEDDRDEQVREDREDAPRAAGTQGGADAVPSRALYADAPSPWQGGSVHKRCPRAPWKEPTVKPRAKPVPHGQGVHMAGQDPDTWRRPHARRLGLVNRERFPRGKRRIVCMVDPLCKLATFPTGIIQSADCRPSSPAVH